MASKYTLKSTAQTWQADGISSTGGLWLLSTLHQQPRSFLPLNPRFRRVPWTSRPPSHCPLPRPNCPSCWHLGVNKSKFLIHTISWRFSLVSLCPCPPRGSLASTTGSPSTRASAFSSVFFDHTFPHSPSCSDYRCPQLVIGVGECPAEVCP